MNPSLDDIENLLYFIPNNRVWLDLLAPQEIEKLVFLVQEVLVKIAGSQPENYQVWAEKFNQGIVKSLKEYEDMFGVKDLASRLNWKEFLKQAYSLQQA